MSELRRHPRNHASVILYGFITALILGTALLMMPVSTVHPGGLPLLPALFTATSALCVTGLTIVDTSTYWTVFGQAVIAVLIQVGGFGVMSFATILGQAVVRKANLNANLVTAAERRSSMGGMGTLLRRVILVSFAIEGVVATVLTGRFLSLGYSFSRAICYGAFHAVSAFNNAGFALYPDNLTRFAGDWWICVPIMFAIVIGGLGFPVIFQLRHNLLKPYKWSLNTRMVLAGTAIILAFSSVLVTVFEWRNPRTLGNLDTPSTILAGIFQAVQTRTSGFNSVDISGMSDSTLYAMDMFMFIGGGPAGTAGGIKITTLFVLIATVFSVIRGRNDASMFGKGISPEVVRQAITVVMLSFVLVASSTLAILLLTDFDLSRTLFEVLSAFGTVGLSAGITSQLNSPSQIILICLMIVGRLGPITVATALAFTPASSAITLPKERPIIG